MSQAGQKSNIKSLYSNTSYGFEYKKSVKVDCLLKC